MEDGLIYYTATAGADKVVTAKPAILRKIIVGEDVSNAVIEISNHKTDGDGDVQIYLSGSNLATKNGAVFEVNGAFSKGITMDLTNQTNVTIIYSPMGIA